MKEWHKTIVLILLLGFAFGFIVYAKQNYQQQFLNQFTQDEPSAGATEQNEN